MSQTSGPLLLDETLGRLDRRCLAVHLEPGIDEGLEELEGHLLGKAALVKLELRSDDDHRTPGIVDPLAQKVLAETSLLALQHVRERAQRPLVGAGDGAAAPAIVEQCVDRFLQHALLVANDDLRSVQLDEPLEPVVAVDHAAVEIVEVRGGEASTVERHQRPQFGRDDRNHLHDHPLGPVARRTEGLDELEALDDLLALCLRRRLREFLAQDRALVIQIDHGQHAAHRLGAHAGDEGVLAVLVHRLVILGVGQQLAALEGCQSRIDDNVLLEVEHLLQRLESHVEQQADAARQRFQKPDVGDRGREFDMPHAFTAHFRLDDLDPATLAHDAPELHALVLAAQALVVLGRTEDAGAHQAIALRLERPVVDGFRLLDLAEGPRPDGLGTGD